MFLKRNVNRYSNLLIISLLLSGCGDESSVIGPIIDPVKDVQTTMLFIYSGISQFKYDHGFDPESITELVEDGYVQIDELILVEWNIFLIHDNTPRNPRVTYIEAISTDEMRHGSGKMLMYDVKTGIFFGYGVESVTSEDVIASLGSIYNATKMFIADSTREPSSVDELIELGYNDLSGTLPNGWTYSFWGNNPIMFIRAVRNGTYNWDSTSVVMITFHILSGTFTDYGEIERSLKVMNTLIDIQIGILDHKADSEYGAEPNSIRELLEDGYLTLDEEIDRTWNFTLMGSRPITQIEAVSNYEYYYGGGHTVLFDVHYGTLTGYGLPGDIW